MHRSAALLVSSIFAAQTIATSCKWQVINESSQLNKGPSRLDQGSIQLYQFHPDTFEAKSTSNEITHKVHLLEDRIKFTNEASEGGKNWAYKVQWSEFPGVNAHQKKQETTVVYLKDAGSCDVKEWNIKKGKISTISAHQLKWNDSIDIFLD